MGTPLVRRDWDALLTEAKRCAGGPQYSAYASRLQQWIKEAYFRIALTYNHYELHKSVTKTVAAGDSSFPLELDAFIVMSVVEVDSTGQPVLVLQLRNEILRQGLWDPNTGQPLFYTRSGTGGRTVQFNRALDTARSYEVQYYRKPVAPDFSTGVYSELDEIWDEVILDWAMVRAGVRAWNYEMVSGNQMLLSDYLGSQVQDLAIDEPQADQPSSTKTNRPRGGLQG